MNERIKELAKQAGFETDEANLSFGNYIQDHEYFYADDFIEDELKKFAELIVKECAEFVDYRLTNPDGASMAWCDGSDIKQHFGVEE